MKYANGAELPIVCGFFPESNSSDDRARNEPRYLNFNMINFPIGHVTFGITYWKFQTYCGSRPKKAYEINVTDYLMTSLYAFLILKKRILHHYLLYCTPIILFSKKTHRNF